jgi:hypothetical protein
MITLKVNGVQKSFQGDPEMPLLWYLRDVLELTGTKFGCGVAVCGSCTIHLNGEAVRSCVTPVKAAEGKSVTTIEGLASAQGLHPVQKAWIAADVPVHTGGADHAGSGADQIQSPSERQGNRRSDVRQHLPLRHLPAHPRRHQGRRQGGRMNPIQNFSRRDFVKGVFPAGAFVLCAQASPLKLLADHHLGTAADPVKGAAFNPSIWLGIEPDGSVTVVAHRSEMGSGSRTGVPIILADELEADWKRVRIVQAIGDAKYAARIPMARTVRGSLKSWANGRHCRTMSNRRGARIIRTSDVEETIVTDIRQCAPAGEPLRRLQVSVREGFYWLNVGIWRHGKNGLYD